MVCFGLLIEDGGEEEKYSNEVSMGKVEVRGRENCYRVLIISIIFIEMTKFSVIVCMYVSMYVCICMCVCVYVCVCVCVCVSWKCSGINYVMTWFVLIALRKAKTTTCLHLSLSYPSFLSSHLYFLPYLSHIYKKKPLFRFSTISPITPLFHPLCSSSIVLFTASFTS